MLVRPAVTWINPRIRPGEARKVVTGIPGKTGVVYTLDRETGEFLWARPTITQNVVNTIDGATGAVTENPRGRLQRAGPGSAGLPHLERRQGLGTLLASRPECTSATVTRNGGGRSSRRAGAPVGGH